MTAITVKANRKANDFYPTPAFATEQLLKHVDIQGTVLECCAGDGAIAKPLKDAGLCVYQADIDEQWSDRVDLWMDATSSDLWFKATHSCNHSSSLSIDWVITNPPFNQASQIVPLAYEYARKGVAMLLRLSYLEPCRDRASWLIEHPINHLIITPRISFTGNGKSDSLTTAWMVWIKGSNEQRITVLPGK